MKNILSFGLTLLCATAISALAQTNTDAPGERPAAISNSRAPSIEEIRAVCIDGRRSICGKILKVLPDGLIVDSGYSQNT
jgi:hypothetical protein